MDHSETFLPKVSPAMQRKTLIGAVAGNMVEFLDFAVYGLLASVLSRIFFPQDAPFTALLSVLLIYASSFLIRPIGGIVLGQLSDRWGRRSVLMITITGMSIITGLTALLPTYSQAGSSATVLLVVFRLVQGFFAGGEYATATDYIVENSQSSRRAFRASFFRPEPILVPRSPWEFLPHCRILLAAYKWSSGVGE